MGKSTALWASAGTTARRAVLERAPIRGTSSIKSTARGLLFVAGESDPSWWLRRGRWEEAVLDPPIAGANANHLPGEPPPDQVPRVWHDRRVIAAQDDAFYTVSETKDTSSLPVITRWRDGKPEIIARASYRPAEGSEVARGVALTLTFSSEDLFWTPDGAIWNAGERLARLSRGSWLHYARSRRGAVREHHYRDGLRVINQVGPPWIFCSESGLDGLWRLDYSPGFKRARLERISVDINVRDAIALDEQRILLIDEKGKILLFDASHSRILSWRGPVPGEKVRHVIRDGAGRLWLAGDSVYLQEGEGKPWHILSRLPIITGQVDAIAPDPEHPDGVVLVTRENEIAFIRAIPSK